jgi:uncharacterized protein (TIGR02001 family)
MKRLMSLTFGTALLGSALAASAADIAGNVTLTTDYRFRGISQNNGKFSPAIQGGFDWSTDSGFYLGTWASNVNFSEGSIETDLYGGFKGKINDDYGYDVGVLYYGYPQDGSTHLSYTEVYTSLSAYGAKVGVNYSDNYFGGSDPFWYWYANYGIEVVKNVNVNAHWGYNHFETRQSGDPLQSNDSFGLAGNASYSDWSLGVSTAALGVTWALTYVDTNVKKDSCFPGSGHEDLCAATAVFSVSKSL